MPNVYFWVIMRKLILLLCGVLALAACDNECESTNDAVVNDTTKIIERKNMVMSSFMEVKRIIPLETSDSCLLSEVEKIIKRNGIIYVKSRNRPLTLFDENGNFLNTVGAVGAGPEKYIQLVDFDVKDDKVYVLTIDKIQVYSRNGEWQESIPLSSNGSALCVTDEEILLFVLGDKYVVHVLDHDGKEKKCVLKRNQALRLNRAISFVRYKEKVLFPMGRSNELLAYDIVRKEFSRMRFLSFSHLTNQKEAKLMEESPQYEYQLLRMGCFDGLQTDGTHVVFPLIKENEVTLWLKNMNGSQCLSCPLTGLENDISFVPASSFFYGNTEDDNGFLTYVMPYQLKEGLENASLKKESGPYLEKLRHISGQSDDEDNPILIEYKIKIE